MIRGESRLAMLMARQIGRLDWWNLMEEIAPDEWRLISAILVQK